MTQTICDRCGKEIKECQGIPVFKMFRTNTGMGIDLCSDCREALIEFMHNCEEDKA